MLRSLLAAGVGLAIGLAIFLALREGDAAPPPGQPQPDAEARPVDSPGAVAAVFVDRVRPGLAVSVLREGRAEPRAQVEVYRAQGELAGGAPSWVPAGREATDEHGRAEFPATTGDFLAVATAADGAVASKHFQVPQANEPLELELALEAKGTWTGTVTDANTRQPLPGAQLRMEHGSTRSPLVLATARADAFGRFSVSGPRLEDAVLRATAEGHLPAWEPLREPTVALELKPGLRLTGHVVDARGAPVALVSVRAGPELERTTTTTDEGAFELLLPPAPVTLYASAPDGRQARERLRLEEGMGPQTVKLTLVAGGALRGLVKTASGPVAGAEVLVQTEPEAVPVATLQTGSSGRFEALGLPPGVYGVVARRGSGARASAIGLEVPSAKDVELELSEPSSLGGLVVDEQGQPVTGALVRLRWPIHVDEAPLAVRSDDQGRYEFTDLLGGEYELHTGLGPRAGFVPHVYVPAGQHLELNVPLTSPGRIEGQVLSPALPDVVAIVSGSEPHEAKVDAQGGFQIELPPGEYHLFARHRGLQFQMKTVEVQPGETTSVQLVIYDAGSPADDRHFVHQNVSSGVSFENAPGGVRVDFLMHGSPAQEAGLQQGDLILSIDGEAARDAADAFARVRRAGDELTLVVRREGADLSIVVK